MRRVSPFLMAGAAAVAMMGSMPTGANAYAPPPPQFRLDERDVYPGERGRQKRKRLARESSGRNYEANRKHLEELRRHDAEWNQAMQCLTNSMKMRWNAGKPGLREKDPTKVWAFHPLSRHVTWKDHYAHLQHERYAGNR